MKESLNIEQDSFGSNEVFPEAQAGETKKSFFHKVIALSPSFFSCPVLFFFFFQWPFFYPKMVIFKALLHQIGAWKRLKWPYVLFSHELGCDMAYQTVSRWGSLPWNQPVIMVHFGQKMDFFCRTMTWKWHLERG